MSGDGGHTVPTLRPLTTAGMTVYPTLKLVAMKPLVLIPACMQQMGIHSYHTVQVKYIDAVVHGANCAPFILPALGEATDWSAILRMVDGIMLTGSPSNVHPDHFGQTVLNPALPLDPARDATTFPLIKMAIQRGIPLIAICRGAQEMNVALGGTLHQAVHEVEGLMDHREDKTAPLDVQYAPAHTIKLTPNGRLATILDGISEMKVNSVHGQGIAQLAPNLQIEAVADDGLIEAFSVTNSLGFSLAMQWHPEWKIKENPDSMKLFGAFGAACQEFQSLRHTPPVSS
jgi:putative glutamine amidotransferase